MDEAKKRVIYSDSFYYTSEYRDDLAKEISKINTMSRDGKNGEIAMAVDGKLESLLPQYIDGKIERYEIVDKLIDTITDMGGVELPSDVDKNDLDEWMANNRESDWRNELEMLGETLGDSELLVFGSIGRWDGTRTGWEVRSDLEEIIQETMKDCEDFEIWDENGHLFVEGIHHDGRNTVEVKMLTEKGEEFYEAWADGYGAGAITDPAFDKLSSDAFSEIPRHAEKYFGCPAEEWVEKADKVKPSIEKKPSLSEVASGARQASGDLAQDNKDLPNVSQER